MITVVFEDSAGRPLADAVISIASAPGEIRDIGMVTDEHGEIALSDAGEGVYDFAVFSAGTSHQVTARINSSDSRVTVVVQ